MAVDQSFHYQPKCSTTGCGRVGVYKVAAPWSYGKITELKNYGVCCEEHRDALLSRARTESAAIKPSDGENVGPIGLYQIRAGVRDAELSRVQ